MRIQLLSSLALVACSSSASAPATFESATDEQLQRTAMAAMGTDMLVVGLLAGGYASLNDGAEGCPRIATEGGRRHVTGGCTTTGNERIDGDLFLENVPGILSGPDSDPTKPQTIEAQDFVVTGGEAGTLRIDGTTSSTPGSGDLAIDVELFDINVRTDASLACPQGRCTWEHATIDVEGLGSATLSGTFAFDGSNEVSLELVGADTLQIGVEGGCAIVTVGKRTSTVLCQAAESPTATKALDALLNDLELRVTN